MNSLILATIMEHKWAIIPSSLEAVVDIATRNIEGKNFYPLFHGLTKEQKEAIVGSRTGEEVRGTRSAYKMGNVGIINVDGPIVPRAGMMASPSSPELASAESIANDFKALENDPRISTIITVMDSPGGAVAGISDLGQMIRSSKKKTIAYVAGMGASAGYWLASSHQQIFSSNTGEVGSIGVVATIQDTKARDEKNGVKTLQFVSSVSPLKRPDLSTEEGKNSIQGVVDALGDIFVDTVAQNRNVSREAVLEKFGSGSMKVASQALEAGMIDGITTLEKLVESENQKAVSLQQRKNIMKAEEVKANHPEAFQEIFQEGMKAGAEGERERIKAIESVKATGAEHIVTEQKFIPNATKDTVSSLVLEHIQAEEAKKAQEHKDSAEALARKAEQISGAHAGKSKEEKPSYLKKMVEGGNAVA